MKFKWKETLRKYEKSLRFLNDYKNEDRTAVEEATEMSTNINHISGFVFT